MSDEVQTPPRINEYRSVFSVLEAVIWATMRIATDELEKMSKMSINA